MTQGKNEHVIKRPLLLVLVVIIGVGAFTFYIAAFLPGKRLSAPKTDQAYHTLYEEIATADLFDDYPETPETVMAFHDNTLLLLYGSNTDDADTLKKILSKQRALYAQELLELNNVEDQFDKLMAARTALAEKEVTVRSIEHPDISYRQDELYGQLCIINTILRLNGETDLYINYCFKQDEAERWKLLATESTDKYFNPVSTVLNF